MAKFFKTLCFLVLVSTGRSYAQVDSIENTEHSIYLPQYVLSVDKSIQYTPKGKHELVFLLRFIDFGCAPCLNNFLDFCDSLFQNTLRYGKKEIVMIFLRDENEEAQQLKTLTKWARVNNLDYPMYLGQENLFNENHIQHSSVVLIDSSFIIEFQDRIPLTLGAEKVILDLTFCRNK